MNSVERMERLRITRQLTTKECKQLKKYEEECGVELTAPEIANMFNFTTVTRADLN